jgi:hypothetical protein
MHNYRQLGRAYKMTNKIKVVIVKAAISFAVLLMLSSFSAAQQTTVGSIAFWPTGGSRSTQSNSSISLGNHTIGCAQVPIWRDADIQKGNNPVIDNTTRFACGMDGVLVGHFVLAETNTGISLTIYLADGQCFPMTLANSDGLRLSDLTEIGYKGKYKGNSIVGFNLVGTNGQ